MYDTQCSVHLQLILCDISLYIIMKQGALMSCQLQKENYSSYHKGEKFY